MPGLLWTCFVLVAICVMTCGGETLSIATHSDGIDLRQNHIYPMDGTFAFRPSTCGKATFLASTKTSPEYPEYKLVINDRKNIGQFVTVLYELNHDRRTYNRVMTLNQHKNICHHRFWISVQFKHGVIAVGDVCSKGQVFRWAGEARNMVYMHFYIKSDTPAHWIFETSGRVSCVDNPMTVSNKENFFQLQGMTLLTNDAVKTRALYSHGFNFMKDKKITVKYQTCNDAIVTLSPVSQTTFLQENYELLLSRRDKRVHTVSTILRRCRANSCHDIGQPLKSTDACKHPATLHIHWSRGRVGAGLNCDQSTGIEWDIKSGADLNFVSITGPGKQLVKWNVSMDSCDATFTSQDGHKKPVSKSDHRDQHVTPNAAPLNASISGETTPEYSNNTDAMMTSLKPTVDGENDVTTDGSLDRGKKLSTLSSPKSSGSHLTFKLSFMLQLSLICYVI